jgi:ATP-dependent Lon protease
VNDRILEFLAVRKLKQAPEGTILCLVGPPGTGKTSLGKSIARTLDRKFFRFSVGGMRDEAEIKGHRRTYVGAMPGKIIQGLKRSGTQNPVFLIDEVDKIGSAAMSGGDPASALLEVLDPEQNPEFLDHYVDIAFNCSQVFFITTANTLDTIPAALLDRMEVIHLSGYTDIEKYHIAKKHLVPKQLSKHALKPAQLQFNEVALKYIIARYAREAGVRNLEKQLAKICRKVALKIALGKIKTLKVDSEPQVEKFLGIPPFAPETDIHRSLPGVATGLAWTQYGGEVLFVESVAVPGRGGFKLTGSLGDVMQESANIAYTYLRGMGGKIGVDAKFFEKNLLHVHVPSGATPKDGPSAGITIVASLYSLLTKRIVNKGIAMTGEITLTGKILPVGGIKEKILAAKRAGVDTVLLPKANEKDLRELEPEVKEGLKFIKVSSLDHCLRVLF